MPTVLEARERASLPYHRWTVAEYHQMADSGILDTSDRVELIEGELIDLSPIGSRHAFFVDRIAELVSGGPRADYMVRVQGPVALGECNEPQPDITLIKRGNYTERHPGGADVLLIVEVSDTTIDYDRDVKLGLYARHGILEIWLLDVNGRELTVYRDPAEGQYRQIRKLTAAEVVSPGALPGVALRLMDLTA